MKRDWYKGPDVLYFVTNTIVGWKPIFVSRPFTRLVLDSWRHFQLKRAIKIVGFVIMPTHLHYIFFAMNEEYGIVEMQRDFKKFLARRIMDGLKYERANGPFRTLECFRRIHRETPEELIGFFEECGKIVNQRYRIWLPDDKPEAVYSQDFLSQKLGYIHQNPVEAGLVESTTDYPFSSARNYELDDNTVFQIDYVNI